jgi:imidazolonepropionase
MIPADLVVRNCRQVVTCAGSLPKRKGALSDVGLRTGAWIASHRGRIVFLGTEDEFKRTVRPEDEAEVIDGREMVALPGFVDAHTHLPFAGTREDEFVLRLKGATYQELAARGLGIQSSVRATRAATAEELRRLALGRLDRMLLHGTTTVEAKSGYGLNVADEVKQLEVLAELRQTQPVDIVPTLMAAHEVGPEFKGRPEAYIDLIIRDLIPVVRKRGLAEFFDIFCEKGVFTVEQTRRLAAAAQAAGFKVKIHADEFVPLGGGALAAEVKAISAEHLIAVDAAGIAALAASETVAVILPAVPFFLMLDKRAPARQLIDAGAVVALATDFNPGSSMTESMLFILELGVFTLKLSVEETLNACTANAACALGRQASIGSLEVGKVMDVLLCEIPSYVFLAYNPGLNPIRHVIKNGRVVVRDGRLALHG